MIRDVISSNIPAATHGRSSRSGLMKTDVAILGGGFAGALAACCLLARGRSVAVFDRGVHPRFAVGESATPAAGFALREIADRFGLPWLAPLTRHGPLTRTRPDLRAGRKRGFAYFRHEPGAAFDPGEDHEHEVLVLASATPERSDVHYDRADLDALLAARAAGAGAAWFGGTEIVAVTPGASGRGYVIDGLRGGGEPVRVAADFVIDAGGPGGVLRRFLNLPDRTESIKTRTRAVYGHVAGLRRWEDALDDAGADRRDHPFPAGEAAVHHVFPDGWRWELRFDDGVTSVGRVFPLGGPARFAPADPFASAAFPSLADRDAAARHVAPAGGPVRTGRLQRRTGRVAGADYALLPAAAGFVDPLHSTGLAHAAAGVLRLCTLLTDRWGRPDLPAALGGYAASVDRELDRIDGLVAPCYAALGDWETFVLALLPYEAAATCGERRPADGELLLADVPAFTAAVADFAAGVGRRPAAALRAELRRSLGPWDSVGLFDPAVRNLHARTAAPGS